MSTPLYSVEGVKSLNKAEYENIYKLDNYLIQDDGSQDSENMNQISDGLNRIDFSKINDNDIELKADLQGLIEQNQTFNSDNQSGMEITTGDVANKFSDVLGNYLNNVNEKNRDAEKAVETFASGGNIDLHSVMIASEKAGLSMQLALQMKNKIIQAYQEVSRIQV